MKRDMENLNLRDSFKPTPDKCHDALMTAARSVKEEEPVRRITFRAVLIAACIILATTAIAIAATRKLGWVDFFEIFYGSTDSVPEEAQKIMNSTEEQTFILGPVSFTVQSLYTDGQEAWASTLITAADGSSALVCGDYSPESSLGSNGENGEALARKLGLDPETTWLNAARQLNCPLYWAHANLHSREPYDIGGGMMDSLYDDQGRLVYFSMKELYTPDGCPDPLPMELWLQVYEIDPETGDVKEIADSQEDILVPMSLSADSVTYHVQEDYTAFGLHLDSVRAEKTVSGMYIYTDLTARDGMTEDEFLEVQLYPVWLDENGEEYPEGMNMSYEINMDHWPRVSITSQIAADSVPDRIWLRLADDNAGPDEAPAPVTELSR